MRKFIWSLFEFVETVVIAVVAVLLIRAYVAQPFLVSGSSMEPNFNNGNYLLIDELTYRFRPPERGEVIVFRYPNNPQTFYIKRVIGLPDETVVIDNGKISVAEANGQKINLAETYLSREYTIGDYEVELAPDQYFVMGDNRNFSYDSRSWGPLPSSMIIGMVRLRLWPVNEVMAFSAPQY
ncbi:MAG: Signal peptidase I [Candidatus Jorgensenbacteria bacterium GW2011_GWA1_48_11]|uniref:Signal peptidase I n=1 Tax=Candidatus Jorgensenbacteria bacterium GW2011_GWA1_48_11 TaxID=1618660 RepID=A0A0G1UC83_9BACT|nr:MAG: Signal peptidase I [Candidatus Jorgensenbacteria bacterium GW2011_GWA1_48_11]KKW12223.1 MAG: Signal peptidase I [Candidatus Jorgensenbacteria bacterium GW2011_GWB1_49_9]